MTTLTLRSALLCLVPALAACAYHTADVRHARSGQATPQEEAPTMQVQYLEIVTPDVDATCTALAKVHGVTFSTPEASLGNARTAALSGGGRIGVRAPMHAAEDPVTRPYLLVDDVEAAVEAARAAGAEIAHPPLEIPGQGTFAIYIQGGVQYGVWKD